MASKGKSSSIFYGWWIIAACFVMSLYTSGVLGYGFTAVINPIMQEFGWSSAQVSFASSMRGVEAGLFAPFIGMIIDRWGTKPVLFVGGVLTGLGMIALTTINSLTGFYLAFGLIALGTSAVGVTTFIAAVATWFHRKLGFAMGLMVSGFGMSGLVVVPATMTIDYFGWRTGMFYMAIGVFIVVLPLSLIMRRRPEDYGLLPDGDAAPVEGETAKTAGRGAHGKSGDKSIGFRQALKSRNFWIISLAFSTQHMIAGGVITHVMPYLSSLDYTRDVGSIVAAAIPLTSIIGRFGFGWLSDRIKNRLLVMAGFLLMSFGLVAFSFVSGGVLFIVLFLLLFTVGFGGTNTMRAILPRAYFGLKGYGTYIGLITGVSTLGSMSGPLIAGLAFDTWGTYVPIWFVNAGIALLCCFGVALLPSVKPGETIAENIEVSPEPVAAGKK